MKTGEVWDAKLRRKSVAELITAVERGRVASLLPLRHSRMAVSAFAFYRGAAAVMGYDLSLTRNSGVETQLCGDAHLQNLGAYEGIDGKLVFDLNDFDETVRGPFEWDVKRMAVSILLAGRDRLKAGEAVDAAEAFLRTYGGSMRRFAAMPVLGVARYAVRRLRESPALEGVLKKAERTSPLVNLEKLTEVAGTRRVFKTQHPVLWRAGREERMAVLGSLRMYRESLLPERRHFFDQYKALDVGFKVVGTGSVGLRDYCVYLEGNGAGDPLFLQVKQEVRSALGPYVPAAAHGARNNGRRVVEGQRAMQLQSDPMLGWTRVDGRDYLVRQMSDHKAALDATALDGAALGMYAGLCGELLARGHARAGNARTICEAMGKGKVFRKGAMRFAEAYAEQTVRDWKGWV